MTDNKIQAIPPRKSLNKAFLRVKPVRDEFDIFKTNLITLLNQIDEKESEEFHKNLVSDFLKKNYPENFINTKGSNDLVIHNGKDNKSSVGVILETKKPNNQSEMLTVDNLNTKALQQLVLYFLRERITNNNLEIKHLIVTNIYEWFIFDAQIFEKVFAKNKQLEKQFQDFEAGRLTGKTTEFFYENIAKPAIDNSQNELVFTHFDIREYQQYLQNQNDENDKQLIPLFKIFSPQHLLKLSFVNDSNTLDKNFYSELLHIIGLKEVKEGSKKLIQRKPAGEREQGSLIENAILRLRELGKIERLNNPDHFGENEEERLFNVSLGLAITWINRILFLKLLETQLIKYNRGNQDFAFLNLAKIKDFGALNRLFFGVLSHKPNERDEHLRNVVANIPYLNSSLFEVSELEHQTIVISNLLNDKYEMLSILPTTVLKDNQGNKRTGLITTLDYIFAFLDAYDFSSEGTEEIQAEKKTLINASVLGLIFEKINGYKDGSFFTPGFITMYMCRETIRRAVIHNFNQAKGWNCENINQLYDRIEDKREANEIINSLKICDPAVGSGHFLVSALNEIIAIKSELKVLLDRQGRTLRDYQITIENDELIITDDDGKLFVYNPKSPESQRIQETIFHEKQTIIENCLFGVDINPNSVNICRLRLWIELLKNAYYTAESNHTELETLPNIDINIKCGNSLISRFSLDNDLRPILRKSEWDIEGYKNAVQKYRHPENIQEKQEMEKLINYIKGNIRTEISIYDNRKTKLRQKQGELENLDNQLQLFEESNAEKKARQKMREKLEEEIKQLEAELEEIESGKIYQNAFEWRFEFPEVLNDEGDFVGFDVVIGNPPYGVRQTGSKYLKFVKINYPIAQKVPDSYNLFMLKGNTILKNNGEISYIVPNTFCDIENGDEFREWFLSENKILKLYDSSWVFEDAIVDTLVYFQVKSLQQNINLTIVHNDLSEKIVSIKNFQENHGLKIDFRVNQNDKVILKKIESGSILLKDLSTINAGVKLYEKNKGNPPQNARILKVKPYTRRNEQPEGWRPLIRGKNVNRYCIQEVNEYVHYGEWLAAPRSANLFCGQRIIIRRTDDVIRATLIIDDSVCVNSCHVLIPNDTNIIKTLLALINSRLIQWVFEIKNSQMVDKTFAEIKVVYIENLPIKLPTEYQQINSLVDQILAAKQANSNADTTALEQGIDQLVYQLYGLTDEEIQIVENTTN